MNVQNVYPKLMHYVLVRVSLHWMKNSCQFQHTIFFLGSSLFQIFGFAVETYELKALVSEAIECTLSCEICISFLQLVRQESVQGFGGKED